MIFGFDHAAGEGDINQLSERLRRPVRFRERVRVPGNVRLVSLDTLLPAARRLRPMRLGSLTRDQVACDPGVVLVSLERGIKRKCRGVWMPMPIGSEGCARAARSASLNPHRSDAKCRASDP